MKILKVKSLLPLRMDKYLLEQYPHLGLGRLNKALRENKIKLNGKKQPLSTRVQAGDEIRMFILDEILEGGAAPEGPLYRSARCPAEIVYEDEQVLVANKPAGLPTEDPAAPDTLYNRACLYLHGQGKSEEEIIATREKAIKTLKEKGFEIVNTLFTDEWYSKEKMAERGVVQIPLCFLAKSLENMSLCHAVYFCKGWENARGCKIEHEAAKAYGLEIIYEE